MLGMSIFGMLASIPGQTIGISVFNDHLMEALHLSRSQLSMAYLAGTLTSAFMLTHGGKVYDRIGGRRLIIGVTVSLVLTLLMMSWSDTISAAVSEAGISITAASMGIVTLGFFLLRFLGQGLLSMVSRNLIMEWFDRRRGFANALLGVCVALGSSAAPRLIDPLIRDFGWNSTWRFMAISTAVFSLAAVVLYRNRPEDHGLLPDGGKVFTRTNYHADTAAGSDFTLSEARRTFAFWLFVLTITISSLLSTAITFHVISIFTEAGLTRGAAIGLFLPASVVAMLFQFGGSWLSDYIPLKWFALMQNIAGILLSIGIMALTPRQPVLLPVLGLGMLLGMNGITGTVTWARYFGRRHMGSVAGHAMAWAVAGSAAGPYIFSISLDITGSYHAALVSCIISCVLLSCAAVVVRRPQKS